MRYSAKCRDIIAIAILAAAVALVALYHSPLFWVPRNDAQVYMLAGKMLADGGRMYLDFFDHKGPVFLGINALGWLLTGNEWGEWSLETLLLSAAMMSFFAGMRRVMWGAFALAFTLGILCIPLEFNHPDTFAVELAILAAGVVTWRNMSIGSCAFAGVCAAMAFLSKLTCVAPFAAFGVFLVLLLRVDRAQALKRMGAYVGGGLLCLLFVLVVLILRGELMGFWQTNIVFNLAYGKSVGGRPVFKFFQLLEMMGTFPALGIIGVCGVWMVSSKRIPLLVPFAVWLVWELVFLLKGLGPWPYQLVGVLFCLYASLGFALYELRHVQKRGLLSIGFAGMMLMAWATSLQAYKLNNAWDAYLKITTRLKTGARLYNGSRDPIPEVERELKQSGAKSLFAKTHQCRLYYDTGMPNPLAPYYYYGPMTTPGYLSDEEVDRLMLSLELAEDLVIVDEKNNKPLGEAYTLTSFAKRFDEFIRRKMVVVESDEYLIYVRRKAE